MEKSDISRPISITLNGTNFLYWAQVMTSFLKSRRVWRIITREVTAPNRKDGETKEKYDERKED